MLSQLHRTFLQTFKTNIKNKLQEIQINAYSTNVLVIGGGAMGSSVAYWLKEKGGNKVNITVVEKDLTYSTCSTCLSVGGIRQQFSVPENIQMSLFGAAFIKGIKDRFGPEADISYMPYGYLILASEKGACHLEENYKLQQTLGVNNQLLSKKQLLDKFSWLNVDEVELGCLGCEKEGWFDPWGLLSLLKTGATQKNAKFVEGKVVDFNFASNGEIRGVEVRLSSNEKTYFPLDVCVIAAGAESGNVAKLAKLGSNLDHLHTPLPVERRKRYVYRFHSQGLKSPGMCTPLTIDHTGVYFRPEGSSYIGGMSPKAEDEPDTSNLDVDFEFFDKFVWPALAKRVPAFESLKIRSAWGGYYEYNTYDENGIIGVHPFYKNLYFATGFSGHGIQQSPAVGLAVAELILDGGFKTIDLRRLGFDRFVTEKPVYETGIY